MTARFFVVSGPSGAGKGTLVSAVRQARPDLGLTVSATTRSPRPGEVDGVSYSFKSDDEFDAMVEAGEFLEWAHVAGHRYGTPLSEVERVLASGRSLILEVDVQGGLNVKRLVDDAVLIFIEPPSFEELERRLRGRGTESDEDVALRLGQAAGEMALAPSYDARIVNDDLSRATADLLATVEAFESE
ncbi:guanylate kinase [Atopobiaceae bacterium 24-176]